MVRVVRRMSPCASVQPSAMPRREPTAPIAKASASTEPSSAREVTPVMRRVANSSRRCSTAKVIVLWIRKAPTTSASRLIAVRLIWKPRVIARMVRSREAASARRSVSGRVASASAAPASSRIRSTRLIRSPRPSTRCASAMSATSRPSLAAGLSLAKLPTSRSGTLRSPVSTSSGTSSGSPRRARVTSLTAIASPSSRSCRAARARAASAAAGSAPDRAAPVLDEAFDEAFDGAASSLASSASGTEIASGPLALRSKPLSANGSRPSRV